MLKGVVLAMLERLFPLGAPSASDFAKENGIALSTFQRAAVWLLGLLPGLLASRKPGPRDVDSEENDAKRRDALEKLGDLRSWLENQRSDTAKNDCYSPEAKLRITTLTGEIHSDGALSYGEIAAFLGISERQLLRIRREVEKADGAAPEPGSRRPKESDELHEEIQKLIANIQSSADPKSPYGPTDIKRLLEVNYAAELLRDHGASTISATTVSKYMKQPAKKRKKKMPEHHPRGAYQYPEPFQQVAIDTSHFMLFGVKYYFITVLELGGRLNLVTRVFLRENSTAVLGVLEEYLQKFPDLGVVVIDRGTPYLNEEVKQFLEDRGKLRVVCPPYTPTAKAACERHFRTLKTVVRRALGTTFANPAGYSREQIAQLLEVVVAAFCDLYHQIPQEGIDGKSPAERIESFDPVRAARLMGELFERALASEPGREYARHLHDLFQLPGSPEETMRRLGCLGTRALRAAAAKVSPYMGPPHPEWLYDPVGFFAAKGREAQHTIRREYLEERYRQEKAKREREEEKRHREELARERAERKEHPERFIERTLSLAIRCAQKSFELGLRRTLRDLGELLRALASRLKRSMPSELERLRARVRQLSGDVKIAAKIETLFDVVGREFGIDRAEKHHATS